MSWTSAATLLPLGLDTFVVAAAVGLLPTSGRDRIRLSVTFALVEGGAPALGLLLGEPFSGQLGEVSGYVAAGVLVGLGLFALLRPDDDQTMAQRLLTARGMGLLALALSVGLDELALGFSLGLAGLPVLPVLVALAVQAWVLTQVGFATGRRLSESVRERTEQAAGVGLILVGLALLVQQLV